MINITFKTAYIIMAALIIQGCSGNKGIEFCEGVDTDGKGVTCGKEFTTGDLTGVLTSRQPFESDSITIKILKEGKNREKPEKTINVNVERDSKRTNFELSFYNAGTYMVEAYRDNDKVGEGTIKITDTY